MCAICAALTFLSACVGILTDGTDTTVITPVGVYSNESETEAP